MDLTMQPVGILGSLFRPLQSSGPAGYTPYPLLHAVFIYSCPGYQSTIKERMLYSSCKEPLIDIVEHHLGLEVVKKVLYVCIYC